MSLKKLEELTHLLHEMDAFYEEAIQHSMLVHAGKWAWNTRTDALRWDDRMHELFDSNPDEFSGTVDWFVQHLHPCDAERIGVYLYGCVKDELPYAATYRTKTGKVIHAYGTLSGDTMSGFCLPQAEVRPDAT